MKLDDAKIRISKNAENGESFYSKRISAFSDQKRAEIVYLNIDRLVPYQRQARRIFLEEELEAMAQTIREHGIRQPLTVLRKETEQPLFEVVSGERRLRAAKIVGLDKVPCIIIQDEEKAEEIALIENIQREDLHPLELAKSIKMLVDRGGWGIQTELHKRIGLSQSQISELLGLAELSSGVQEVVLEKNFKGRENLRKLLQIQSDLEKISFINAFSDISNGNSKISKIMTRSVLRLSISENGLKIQKTKIKTLTESEKRLVKEALHSVLEEL